MRALRMSSRTTNQVREETRSVSVRASRLPFARAVFWLFCAATFSLAVAALLGTRPPTWQLVGFGLLFFSFATLGVLFPQLQMYGSVLCRGAAGKQRIALSFDDGPHPETTRKILAILADNNALATFFVV